jgi:hypothetical protein
LYIGFVDFQVTAPGTIFPARGVFQGVELVPGETNGELINVVEFSVPCPFPLTDLRMNMVSSRAGNI